MNEFTLILITVLLSAFFSGMEIAFVSANKMTLEMDKKAGSISAGLINIFTAKPGQYIATMLVGNNISLVIYGLAFASLLEPFILLFVRSATLVLLIQTLISTLIILFTAEFLPKTLFRLYSNGALKTFAIPIFLFYVILWPVANFSMFVSKGIIKFLFRKDLSNESDNQTFTKIDLNHYINQLDNSYTLEQNEEEETEIKLFKNALDFSNVKVRDCMIPRPEVSSLEVNSTIEELNSLMIETGHSKIIIFKESIDNIIGYVHISQLFSNPPSIKSIVNTISIVPETISANKLLSMFTQKHKSIAVVVDEFGGTSGIITTEDVLEEIFGEIEDEHDTDDLIQKQLKENEWIFSARFEISQLNEKYGFNLNEEEEYDTLAGLLLHHHESIPKVNTIITIHHFEFRVLKATNTKIELVLLKMLPHVE